MVCSKFNGWTNGCVVTDRRHHMCEAELKTYDLGTMPQTSVVFVFYNEAMSTLLRSIHSVLNRSPPELLCEIILVDDHSDHEWLGAPLEEYIKLLPKVRLIRMPVRGGLVKARLKGAEEARAETFTVLDSHIEVEPGWLEPIMHRMREPTRIIMPQIDTTNPETIIGSSGGIGCTLGFLWSLVEHAIDVQPKDKAKRKSPIDPVPSPTHAGGLFTANKEYFFHIGGYDRDFGFWGTENLEFSFRIWQCGGTLECAPCSRVCLVIARTAALILLCRCTIFFARVDTPGQCLGITLRRTSFELQQFGWMNTAQWCVSRWGTPRMSTLALLMTCSPLESV